ncbi:MAG: prolyl oligopeptidase family serine peptidase [Deltaproteobacteria bacterium]|nr:prolyl oligopeptidase family serine peptidase [Deltaproteobacteria bacterium]
MMNLRQFPFPVLVTFAAVVPPSGCGCEDVKTTTDAELDGGHDVVFDGTIDASAQDAADVGSAPDACCAPGDGGLDGGDDDSGTDGGGDAGFADGGGCTPVPLGVPGTYQTEKLVTFVKVQRGGSTYNVYVRQVRPKRTDHPGVCFPAVLKIPGGWGAGAPLIDQQDCAVMASAGVVVTAFNPESRGSGEARSDGPVPEDYNGYAHQDDCAAVVAALLSDSQVDMARVGVWSHSNGITIASGCLNRHPELEVKFLMDEEGPHCPKELLADPDAQIDPALRDRWSQVLSEKVGPGLDYENEDGFWAERCAVNQIGGVRASYQRFQAEVDHALGVYYHHTVAMNNTAVSGGVPWVRLNTNALGVVYGENDLSAPGVLLSGKLADHQPELLSIFKELMER